MTSKQPSRRGAAMLLVLAALILTVTAAAALARGASMTQLRRRTDLHTAIADDLLRATEAPVVEWLQSESADVVLPPEATEPRIPVLHNTWIVEGTEYEIRITAWDQCGMVPLDRARSGSPLRLALPPAVLETVDRTRIPRGVAPGLDAFASSRFPEPAGADEATQIGALVATHNPSVLNVNTAPMPLLEAGLRSAGRGGLDMIVNARSDGEQVPLGAPPAEQEERQRSLRIVSSSPAWAIRIDIRVGSASRSWWAVYVQSNSSWECVQRLAIAT